MINKKPRVRNNNCFQLKKRDNCLPCTINVTCWRKSRSRLPQIEQNHSILGVKRLVLTNIVPRYIRDLREQTTYQFAGKRTSFARTVIPTLDALFTIRALFSGLEEIFSKLSTIYPAYSYTYKNYNQPTRIIRKIYQPLSITINIQRLKRKICEKYVKTAAFSTLTKTRLLSNEQLVVLQEQVGTALILALDAASKLYQRRLGSTARSRPFQLHSLARRETRQRSKVHELLRSASVLHSAKRYNAIGDPVSRCRPENHRRLLTLLKSDTINSIYISSPLFFLSLFYSLCFLPSQRIETHREK